jgi:hypothetical protein
METKGFSALLNHTSKVSIVANETIEGNPIVTPLMQPNGDPKTDILGNPLGSIRLQQRSRSLNNGSFLNTRNRVAFITAPLAELLALVEQLKMVDGTEIDGKIVVTESLQPFWPTQTPKINPNTQETIGVTVNGTLHPVYLRMTYTEDMTAKDTYIRTPEDVILRLNAQVAAAVNQPAAPVVEAAAIPQA